MLYFSWHVLAASRQYTRAQHRNKNRIRKRKFCKGEIWFLFNETHNICCLLLCACITFSSFLSRIRTAIICYRTTITAYRYTNAFNAQKVGWLAFPVHGTATTRTFFRVTQWVDAFGAYLLSTHQVNHEESDRTSSSFLARYTRSARRSRNWPCSCRECNDLSRLTMWSCKYLLIQNKNTLI